jgi:uncharacterized protein
MTFKAAVAALILVVVVGFAALIATDRLSNERDGLLDASEAYKGAVTAYNRGEYATALRQFRPLAEQGNVLAQYSLGLMYSKGQGVTQNYAEAAKWYRKAADQGDDEAQYELGRLYNEPTFRFMAEEGDAEAQFQYGALWYG